VSEARQRWRLVFRRGEAAMYMSHLDAVHAWERALRRGGIPVTMTEGFNPRPRLVFAAPLSLGMLAEHELADLVVAERLTLPELRPRLVACLPRGYEVTELFDVWVGEPALAPQIAAADYRLTLLGVGADELRGAAERLLAAESLPRTRSKESRTIRYDLRPLVRQLEVRWPGGNRDGGAAGGDGGNGGAVSGEGRDGPVLWMRLRHSQEGGTGRAEEVVAALADVLGVRFSWTGSDEEGVGTLDGTDVSEGVEDAGATVNTDATANAKSAANPDVAIARETTQLEVLVPVRERLWLADEL
jgi:radical SAM-linked protein